MSVFGTCKLSVSNLRISERTSLFDSPIQTSGVCVAREHFSQGGLLTSCCFVCCLSRRRKCNFIRLGRQLSLRDFHDYDSISDKSGDELCAPPKVPLRGKMRVPRPRLFEVADDRDLALKTIRPFFFINPLFRIPPFVSRACPFITSAFEPISVRKPSALHCWICLFEICLRVTFLPGLVMRLWMKRSI